MQPLGRSKQEKEKWHLKRLVVLDPEMFQSPAFLDLSKTATVVVLRFLQKRTWDGGKKRKKLKNTEYLNEDIIFTGREAASLGISESSFRRAIKDLVAAGFIIVSHQGGNHGPERDPSRYRLSETWRLYGTPEFPSPKKPACVDPGTFHEFNEARKKLKATAKNDCRPAVKNDCRKCKNSKKGVHL